MANNAIWLDGWTVEALNRNEEETVAVCAPRATVDSTCEEELIMASIPHHNPNTHKTINVCEIENEYGNRDWPADNAAGFIRWFQDKIETVPAEFRDKIVIEINARCGYGDSAYAEILIQYARPETDEEAEQRENAVLDGQRSCRSKGTRHAGGTEG